MQNTSGRQIGEAGAGERDLVKHMCGRENTNHRRVKTRGIHSNSKALTTLGPLAQGEGGGGGPEGDLPPDEERCAGESLRALITHRRA
jgi:hypothetical protein